MLTYEGRSKLLDRIHIKIFPATIISVRIEMERLTFTLLGSSVDPLRNIVLSLLTVYI